MNLPVELPSIVNAKLPAAYQQAKQALATCDGVDEGKTWVDKMVALASYGLQAKDDSLVKFARRIRNRAMQRAGELLEEFVWNRRGALAPLLGPSTLVHLANGASTKPCLRWAGGLSYARGLPPRPSQGVV